jgi:transposase
VSGASDLPGDAGEQRELLARLRAVVEAKDAENAVLRAELSAEREVRRRLELRLAELERRLGMDSSNSGTPSSKESIEAGERRKAERKNRDTSERERRKDRKRGGQPGHRGSGLSRDPDPDERKTADPPAECSGCGASLAGAAAAGSSWAQVWDVKITRWITEWLLPSLACPCCGKFTTADAPAGASGDHLLRDGDQRGGGAAQRVRECAVRAGRATDRDAAGHASLVRVRGPGQRPAR